MINSLKMSLKYRGFKRLLQAPSRAERDFIPEALWQGKQLFLATVAGGKLEQASFSEGKGLARTYDDVIKDADIQQRQRSAQPLGDATVSGAGLCNP